ncbi:MAG: methyl-accepting chemotaxis protein [Candidatus Accumulibacter sp.]|nr:methyl-accepting chemotaxis protein [Candidatus Accumulibacter conexus]
MFVASISPAIVANYLFDRSLLAGMVVAARRLGDLARGDLTSAARAVSRRDEVGDLLRSTEVAGDNIVQTVREIRAAAETLTDSAARVEETVDGVAQGARSQDAVHRARTTMADIVALARLLVVDMRQIAEGLAAQRQGSGEISCAAVPSTRWRVGPARTAVRHSGLPARPGIWRERPLSCVSRSVSFASEAARCMRAEKLPPAVRGRMPAEFSRHATPATN